MSKIRFQVLSPLFPENPAPRVTGSLPALGNWNPAEGLELKPHGIWREAEFATEEGEHFEYKITRGSWQTEAVDAWGDVLPNRSHEVWGDATLHVTVADWKDTHAGRLTRERVGSRILADSREILIWLPPSYALDPERRFPVIYLHDGDNLFDPQTSPITGVDWAADEWVRLLARTGGVPESIVAGVCHPDGFNQENIPLRDVDLSPELGGPAYAAFVASELAPYLDTHYRTDASPLRRTLGGADLGALNAFYTAIHHPGVFSRFLCLSTRFGDLSDSPAENSRELAALECLPGLPRENRFYFDYGTRGLDAGLGPFHERLGAILREKGARDGAEFQIARVEGGGHDEASWRQRFGPALRFLAQ
ncbi:MAG TPA: alpha/beta hydrolase-fold protein [Chthoniobacterales bacterium]